MNAVQCVEGDIRLAEGNATSGRVEVCLDEQWTTLCFQHWTAVNARVVCRQLGYESEGMPCFIAHSTHKVYIPTLLLPTCITGWLLGKLVWKVHSVGICSGW